jgi:hypothetical protein
MGLTPNAPVKNQTPTGLYAAKTNASKLFPESTEKTLQRLKKMSSLIYVTKS